MGRRKKVTYRPSKANGVFGVISGSIFVLIGLFVAIPVFGVFGILWTAMAVGITGYTAYSAFGKGYVGTEIHIEEDDTEHTETRAYSVEQRLQELRNLYDRSLITEEEYEAKKRDILNDL